MKNINITKKSLHFILGLLLASLAFFSAQASIFAAPQDSEPECTAAGGQWVVVGPEVNPPIYGCQGLPSSTGGTATGTTGFTDFTSVECSGNNENCCNGVTISIDVECTEADNPILGYLAGIANFLAAGVGLVVTAMIIMGGIQYITAGGVPQKLEAARRRITNAVIALITFLFLYGLLQWAIPGGAFNSGGGQQEDASACLQPGQEGPC